MKVRTWNVRSLGNKYTLRTRHRSEGSQKMPVKREDLQSVECTKFTYCPTCLLPLFS